MIWMEEINEFLILATRDTVGEDIPVFYSTPEFDPDEDLPRVALNIYDLRPHFDRLRVDYNVQLIQENTEDTITLADTPAPYWIYYQFTTLTDLQQEAIQLQTEIIQRFPFRKHVDIGVRAKTEFSLDYLTEPLTITVFYDGDEVSQYEDVDLDDVEETINSDDEYIMVTLMESILKAEALDKGESGNKISVDIDSFEKSLEGGDRERIFMESVEYKQPIPDLQTKSQRERRSIRRFKGVLRYRLSAELPPKDAEETYYKVKERNFIMSHELE